MLERKPRPAGDDKVAKKKEFAALMPPVQSQERIRAALAEGAEQQTVLAPAVAEYIRSHSLYRPVGIP